MKKDHFVTAVLTALCMFVPPISAAQEDVRAATPANDALQIRVHGKLVLGEADLQQKTFASEAAAMAEFRRNVVPIQRYASLQLGVEVMNERGRGTDVTKHSAITYQSLAPSKISVSSTGLVTAAPGTEEAPALGGDLAVLVNYDHPKQSAWNKVFFRIVP